MWYNNKKNGTNLLLEIVFWRILIHFLDPKDEVISRLRDDVDAKASKISELEQNIAAARDSQLPAFRTEIDVLCTILEEIASIYHGAPDDGLGDALRGRDERIAPLMKKIEKHGHPITLVEGEVLNKARDQLSEKLARLVRELDGWKRKEEEMARREIEMENRLADYESFFKVPRSGEEMARREMENRLMDYQLPFKVPRCEEEEMGPQIVALPDRARSGRTAKDDIVKELENQLKEARDELRR
jgi:hypothetical protein